MKTLPIYIILIFLPVILLGQKFQKRFKNYLESDSKLFQSGYNFTVERTKDGLFIFKRYHATTLAITEFTTYKTALKKNKTGFHYLKYDNGDTLSMGYYENNIKVGNWVDDYNYKGNYKNGKREGKWIRMVDGKLWGESHYSNGKLNGISIQYDSLGLVIARDTFMNDSLLNTNANISSKVVEEMPAFSGCDHFERGTEGHKKCSEKNMLEFVYKNIRYPKDARKKGIEGKAILQFVINKDGSVTDIRARNGLSPDIAQECIDLINRMPKWEPGTQNGEPVKVMFYLPIVFRLE